MRTLRATLVGASLMVAAGHGATQALAVEPGAPHRLLTHDVLVAEALEAQLAALPARAEADGISAMKAFYAARDFRPIWITEQRLGEAALRAADEISKADTYGLDPSAFRLPEIGRTALGAEALVRDELTMTRAVLSYAVHARGGRIDPRKLSAYLDRGAYPVAPKDVLAGVASNPTPDAYLRGLQPQHPEFKRLRARYLALLEGDGAPDRVTIPGGPTLRKGTRHPQVALLRERLGVPAPQPKPELVSDNADAEGEAEAADPAIVAAQRERAAKRLAQTFGDPLNDAVRAFQKKNGLKVDGIVGSGTRRALNGDGVALKKRLLVNMERWRWMPQDLGDYYVWANIPDYRFYIVKNGEIIHTERVVVGKYQNQTTTFSDEMEKIVFNPRWYVPPSIKEFDLRSASAIRRKGLRVQRGGRYIDPGSVDWSTANMARYNIYQPSGPSNALGKLKFLFPNKHAIYFHDTPKKSLFNRTRRAYSHGCVRVRDPRRFAEILLANDQGISRATVGARLAGGQRSTVFLEKKVPVHITYFTARADGEDGEVRVLSDIYRHDNRISRALAGKKVPYIAQNALSGRKRVRRTQVTRRKKNNGFWINNIFGLN
ncbi:MAG: L,D-transpeptidase family protein [Pseudomonadota bacterium]